MIAIGLSHRHAPIEIRERLAIAPSQLEATLQSVHALQQVSEAVILSTCNRVEIYAAGADEDALVQAITAMLGELGGREVVPFLKIHRGNDAILQLFRVASSLDSLVVGEPQILGQLKGAITAATDCGTIGPELHYLTRRALQAAKRIRTATAIGAGQVSVPSVAVELAKHIFDPLSGKLALVVGAGEMAEAAAKLLGRAGAELRVVNRSVKRAAKLAAAVGGDPAPWDQLEASLIETDIVVSSTASSDFVISKQQITDIRRKRRGRSLFLIDIAVPRDVDPAVHDLDNVYLYDVDDLSHVVAQSLDERLAEAERAEVLIVREVTAAEERLSQQTMAPVIVALREHTRKLLGSELERSCRGKLKHLSDDDRHALTAMLESGVNKLMHSPTRRLKELATSPSGAEAMQLVEALFELGAESEGADKAADRDGPANGDGDGNGDDGDAEAEADETNNESAAAGRMTAR